MDENKTKECPIDAYPLDSEGFCSRCNKTPTFPPSRGFSFNEKSGIGAGVWFKGRALKRYEFEDQWQNRVVSSKEVLSASYDQAFNTIAHWYGYQSWDDYVKANVDVPGEHYKLIEEAKELAKAAYDALLESEDIEKVTVELTEWEKYYEEQVSSSSLLRISEGVYFGLSDASMAALKAVFAFISIDPGSWVEIVKKVGSGSLAIKGLFKVYRKLSGDPKIVFEAIHKFSSEARRIRYDEHHHSPKAYGSRGPTLGELENQLAGELKRDEIRDALDYLKEERVIDNKRGMWSIRF